MASRLRLIHHHSQLSTNLPSPWQSFLYFPEDFIHELLKIRRHWGEDFTHCISEYVAPQAWHLNACWSLFYNDIRGSPPLRSPGPPPDHPTPAPEPVTQNHGSARNKRFFHSLLFPQCRVIGILNVVKRGELKGIK